jgi:cyanophycinase-like exopeptidase
VLSVTLSTPVRLLVLIGGGEFSFGETRAVDEFLVANMRKKSVAFLPTASGSAEYATHFGKYLKSIDPEIETTNVPIYRGRDARRQKSLNAIFDAGLVYLGGGVTNNLLETIRESPVDLTMRDAAKNGTIVAAIGAAASAFGTHARDMRSIGRALPGLGWIANSVIESPFVAESDDGLRRMMSTPDTTVGIGIPPNTALVIRSDGSTEIVGEGQIAVFRKPTGL